MRWLLNDDAISIESDHNDANNKKNKSTGQDFYFAKCDM